MKNYLHYTAKIFLLIFFLLVIVNSNYSQLNMQWKDAAFYGPAFSLHIDSNMLYVGSGSAFRVFDITDAANPAYKGHCHTTDCITYIFCHNNICYAGNNGLGVSIIDVSDPTNPVVNKYIFPDSVVGYEPVVSGSFAYFPRGSYGISVMDITDPYNPVHIHKWNEIGHDFSIDIVKKDSILYLTDRSGGLYRLKISGTSLSTIDNFKITGYNFLECATDDSKNFLFVTGYPSALALNDSMKLWVFDIQDTSNFQLIGFVSRKVYSYPLDLKVSNGIAYVSAWSSGSVMFDVSDPYNIQEISVIPSDDMTNWTDVLPPYAYTAELSAGFKITDISDPSSPQILSRIDSCGDTKDIFVNEPFLYAAIDGEGIGIAEIGTDGLLKEKNLWNVDGGAYDVFIYQDTILFVASGSKGVIIADISNPFSPDSITCMKHLGTNGAVKVIVKNNLAAVAEITGPHGLLSLWNITDIHAPLFITSLTFLNEPVNNIDWFDSLIIAACWTPYVAKSVKVIDVSSPLSPFVLGSYNCFSSDVSVFKKNDSLYAAVSIGSAIPFVANGLSILNITYPSQITQTDFFQTGIWGNMTAGVFVFDHYALIAEGGLAAGEGLIAYDIQDVYNINETEKLRIGSNTSNNSIFANSNYIYHSTGSAGVIAVKWDGPNTIHDFSNIPKFIRIYPNPASDYITIEFLGKISLQKYDIYIFNIQGQLILQQLIQQKGVTLDISQLAKGIYIVKLSNRDNTIVTKLVKE
jgi:hypothetical protein